MNNGDCYIAKTDYRPGGIIEILFIGDYAVKVKWNYRHEEWVWREDFKARNEFVNPKIKIIEKLN